MPIITQRLEAKQYDGTNGAEIIDWLDGSVDLVSDDGTRLEIFYVGSPRTIHVGGWVIAGGGGTPTGTRTFIFEATDEEFRNSYVELSLA